MKIKVLPKDGFIEDQEESQVSADNVILWSNADRLGAFDIYVFDFDGVLVPHRGSIHHVNIDEKEHMLRFIRDANPGYLYKPCKNLQNFIKTLDPQQIYVLGAVANSFESHLKEAFIQTFYPEVPATHIIWVDTLENKVRVMAAMYDTWERTGRYFPYLNRYRKAEDHGYTSIAVTRKSICMIDDSFLVLKDFEDQGFSTLHNSEFL